MRLFKHPLKSDSNGQHEPGDDEGGEPDDVKLSGALVEDLTAHRTAALRAVLATRPDMALVATAQFFGGDEVF